METLSGLVATVDRKMVSDGDLALLNTVRTELIELTLKYHKLNHLELLVDGYNDDPRALYDVPEVNRWMRLAAERWPDLLFWLTPGSLWLVVLCLNPTMHQALPDHRVHVAMNLDEVAAQTVKSGFVALEVLRERGLPKDAEESLLTQARENLPKLQKRLGDYAVVHPKTGAVQLYKR